MAHVTKLFRRITAPVLALLLACLGLETLRDHPVGWLLLIAGTGFPVVEILGPLARRAPDFEPRKAPSGELPGGRPYGPIVPGILAALFAPPLESLYLPPPIPWTPSLGSAGILLVLFGLALLAGAGLCTRGTRLTRNAPTGIGRLAPLGDRRAIRAAAGGILTSTFGLALGYSSLIGLLAVPGLLLPGLALTLSAPRRHTSTCSAGDSPAPREIEG